jgi:hypothetical protein
MSQEYLSHHGIKGQKWGVRRFQNRNGTLTAAGKKRKSNKTKGWSKDAKRAYTIKKKKVSQMTNKELSELNKRQELENKYRQNNPSAIKRGIKVAGAIAGGMGTIAALYNNSGRMIDLGKKTVNSMSNMRTAYVYADAALRAKRGW